MIYQGNLGRVDFITENEYDVFVRPDTCNPRARFWHVTHVQLQIVNKQLTFFRNVNKPFLANNVKKQLTVIFIDMYVNSK